MTRAAFISLRQYGKAQGDNSYVAVLASSADQPGQIMEASITTTQATRTVRGVPTRIKSTN
jgi:hypothetical protein